MTHAEIESGQRYRFNKWSSETFTIERSGEKITLRGGNYDGDEMSVGRFACWVAAGAVRRVIDP